MGTFILALGMASCKTYCPAYNYANVEAPVKAKVTAAAVADETVDLAKS